MKNKKLSAFIISLISLLLISTLMWGIATSWGYVKIERIKLIGDDGLTYSALTYTPKDATNETPAPIFMGQHGRSSSARDMEVWALEMARRGYVCVLPDVAGGGESQLLESNPNFGPMDLFVNYILSQNFVIPDQLNAAGISAGTDTTGYVGTKYGEYCRSITLFAPVGKAASQDYHVNLQIIFGNKDESIKPEQQGEGCLNMTLDAMKASGDPAVQNMTSVQQLDQTATYGDIKNNTGRRYRVYDMIHMGGTFNFGAIGAMIDWIQDCNPYTPHKIDSSNQIWQYREGLGLLCVINLVVTMCFFASLLLDKTDYFGKIKQDLPKNVGFQENGNKVGFWISVALGCLFPIFSWIILPNMNANTRYEWFPLGNAVPVMSWMLWNAGFGLIMFLVFHFTEGKKHSDNPLADYGLTYHDGRKGLSFELIFRSFVLAFLVAFVGFQFLDVLEELTGLSPHCWFISYTHLVDFKLRYVPRYFLLYFFAFLISALSMNVERRLKSTGDPTKDLIRALVINMVIAGFGAAIILGYQWFFIFNTMNYPGAREVLSMTPRGFTLTRNSDFPMIFMVLSAAYINTYCYKKSGSIWLGVFLCALFVATAAVMGNSVTFIN